MHSLDRHFSPVVASAQVRRHKDKYRLQREQTLWANKTLHLSEREGETNVLKISVDMVRQFYIVSFSS